jgi:Polyketide cyclase / dehydrase and lipid transport
LLKKIAIAFVLIVVVLAGYIATRPSEFRISRSRTVAAPPGVVYGYVNDFHKWPEWSPWEKLDPAMKKELSGAPAGPDAVYFWSGNDKVGEGRMTITDSRLPQSVTIRLEFIKPWTATNTAQFDFVPSGSGTNVTWAMRGHNNFVAKAFSVFMDLDKLVGPDFERGLANLDAATEAAMKRATPTAAPGGGRS